MQQKLRAAVAQSGSVVFDADRTIDKVAAFTGDAARQGAQLIVFPEAFVSAYPKGLDFGATIGGRTAAGRDDYRRYDDSALEVPGPGTRRLGEVAAEYRQYIVIGVIERNHGTLYCTALFYGPGGMMFSKHRKLMPTAAERLIWGYGEGRPCRFSTRRSAGSARSFAGKTTCH